MCEEEQENSHILQCDITNPGKKIQLDVLIKKNYKSMIASRLYNILRFSQIIAQFEITLVNLFMNLDVLAHRNNPLKNLLICKLSLYTFMTFKPVILFRFFFFRCNRLNGCISRNTKVTSCYIHTSSKLRLSLYAQCSFQGFKYRRIERIRD